MSSLSRIGWLLAICLVATNAIDINRKSMTSAQGQLAATPAPSECSRISSCAECHEKAECGVFCHHSKTGDSLCSNDVEHCTAAGLQGVTKDAVCPVNGKWSEWGKCTQDCSPKGDTTGGTQERTCEGQAAGGVGCEGELKRQCGLEGCKSRCAGVSCAEGTTCHPLDFAAGGSESGPWSKCVAEEKVATDDNTKAPAASAVQPGNGGAPVDCVTTEWSDWSACSGPCGMPRKKKRTMTITTQAMNGGVACPSTEEVEFCAAIPCDTNCAVGNWSEWTKCSVNENNCGMHGTQHRARPVLVQPSPAGKECPRLLEERPCGDNPCPIDCVWGEWDEEACTDTCDHAGNLQVYRRALKVEAQNGGICSGEATRMEGKCKRQYAPCCTSCQMGNWSDWSNCTALLPGKFCGLGRQSRTRPMLSEPKCVAGLDCPFTTETQYCKLPDCPQDCELSEWTTWSQCTEKCGAGATSRVRIVVTKNHSGGVPCPAPENLIETKPCNEQGCPVDCKMGAWGVPSPCSQTCGAGTRRYTRKVETAPLFGGAMCGPEVMEEVCNSLPCPGDCIMDDWASWTACDAPCGGGQRFRTRSVLTRGVGCKDVREIAACNDQPCEDKCEMTEFTGFSECSKDCTPQGADTGFQTANRRLKDAKALNQTCGSTSKVAVCNAQFCPVDCLVTSWGTWTPCTKECNVGSSQRFRRVVVFPQFGGKACPKDLTESRTCNKQPCLSKCVYDKWGSWGACRRQEDNAMITCGSGVRTRKRSIVRPSAGGAAPCCRDGSDPSIDTCIQQEKCSMGCCAVDCQVEEWGEWSACSTECGWGQRKRARKLILAPECGGQDCGPLMQFEDCKVESCCDSSKPDTCAYSKWADWGECSKPCGGGVQFRSREVAQDCELPGAAKTCAAGPLKQSQVCNDFECPKLCEVSEWSAWGVCSVTCGVGEKTRSRKVVQPPRGADSEACPPMFEVAVCTTRACHCSPKYSDWSSWSECSATCGGGVRTRGKSLFRGCPTTETSPASPPSLYEEEPCNAEVCCPIHCQVGEWTEYGNCDAEVGPGYRYSTRDVVVPPNMCGSKCPLLSRRKPCFGPSPVPKKCKLSPWSLWSSCSVTCGAGTRYRTRALIAGFSLPEGACGNLRELDACMEQPCPEDCSMSAWGPWSKCNNDGFRRRTRSVIRFPSGGGAPCDPCLVEKDKCVAPDVTNECTKEPCDDAQIAKAQRQG